MGRFRKFLENYEPIFEDRVSLEPIFYSQIAKSKLAPIKNELFLKQQSGQELSPEEQSILRTKPKTLKQDNPQLDRLVSQTVDSIFKTDPTGNKTAFAKAILNWYMNGSIKLPNEDEETTRDALISYMKYGRQLNLPKPINTKTPSEFMKPIRTFVNQNKTQEGDPYHDLEIVSNKGKIKVYKIDGDYNEGSCKRWMKDTEWCVKYPDMFKQYGPPFYMIVDGNDKFLFHIPSVQFKNAEDLFIMKEFEKYKDIVKPFFDRDNNNIKPHSVHDEDMLVMMYDNWEEMPVTVKSVITDRLDLSVTYAEYLIYHDKKVPKQVIQTIATAPKKSFEYAKLLNFNNIPEEIISSVGKSPTLSFDYAEWLNFKNVPKEIIQRVARSADLSIDYAEALKFKDIPEEIIKGFGGMKNLSDNSKWALKYAKSLDFKNVPKDIIYRISTDDTDAFNYAYGSRFKDVPEEIIKGISNNPYHSYDYAGALNFKNVPHYIDLGIGNDPHLIKKYYEELKKRGFKISSIIKSVLSGKINGQV